MDNTLNDEISAINSVHAALEPLDDEARTRVLDYVISVLRVEPRPVSHALNVPPHRDADSEDNKAGEVKASELGHASFADFYAAANPKTNGERALVAGYWIQVCQSADAFTGAAANKELMNLGHRLTNITDAINAMRSRKPALILQVKKSGSSKQSRKLYKVSHEGEKRVAEMTGG